MDVEIELRSVYLQNPGRALGEAFVAHVRATGQPETFPTISTTRPPDEGEIVVLAFPVEVERGRRPEKDMAPCPICAPASPKWLRGGTLVWCAATSAIYAIGPKCSTDSEWTRKLALAQNEFQREERERENAADLARAVELADARIAWIDAALPVVRRVDELQNDLGRKLPILKQTLGKMARGGDPIGVDVGGAIHYIGRVRGDSFLRSTWREASKLERAGAALLELRADCGDEEPHIWAAALAPRVCAEKLKASKTAAAALQSAAEHVAAAVDFLGDETARTLTAWRESGTAPHGLRFSRAGTTTTIMIDDKMWRADQVVKQLPPPPS